MQQLARIIVFLPTIAANKFIPGIITGENKFILANDCNEYIYSC